MKMLTSTRFQILRIGIYFPFSAYVLSKGERALKRICSQLVHTDLARVLADISSIPFPPLHTPRRQIFQAHDLAHPQTSRIGAHEQGAMLGMGQRPQDTQNLCAAQDHRPWPRAPRRGHFPTILGLLTHAKKNQKNSNILNPSCP